MSYTSAFLKLFRRRRSKDCRTDSNKSGVLAMSAEVMMIRAVRSSAVATGVSHTSDFRWTQKKKFKGLRSGECGIYTISLPYPGYLPVYEVRMWEFTAIEKCSGAPPCMNHTFWSTVLAAFILR
ncbi:hypothetical protein TNCV_3812401 [Trichonephila clavipes]|nr:hypothetical protein TNCV_3812401 [Trichonephila clavipes]